ncbi:hypothetical protein C0Q70_13484 [Pomacea canaliculata]|uniref:Serine aminopeptidase S33 domain-containing protein n=1 Tax=Pomacea canaliculata TaxID=400727 RepID=A0A2T7NXC8_POMCA|nr:hypothetical protein C0Q70_13484 [Pomacea canaliculata]
MDATTCSDKEPKGNILSQIVVPVMVRWTQKLKVLWHKLPVSLSESKEVAWDKYEESLRSGKTIFLYLHGNSGTRGGYHRVQIYKFLSQLDAHVLTIDYRGFGDSTGTPSEEGVVHDAYFAYKWLKSKSNNAPIFIWGHSLGTGCVILFIIAGDDPVGVILEAPFNNILEAAEHHPFSLPFRLLPWFKSIFIDSIKEHGIQFSSDENIMKVTPHILILHAEDDGIVPFHLGHKLYQKAKETRTPATGDVELVVFQGHHGLIKLVYMCACAPVVNSGKKGPQDVEKMQQTIQILKKQLLTARRERWIKLPVEATLRRIMKGEAYSLEAYRALEDKLALLDQATALQDGNAITAAVLHLRHTVKKSIFSIELAKRPVAANHYLSYLRAHYEHAELVDTLVSLRRTEEASIVKYKVICNSGDVRNKVSMLKTCLRTHFEADSSMAGDAALVREHVDLLERQLPIEDSDARLEAEGRTKVFRDFPRRHSLLDMPLTTTLFYSCLYHHHELENSLSSPLSLKKRHEIPERQYIWTALSARAKAHAWADIENLLTAKSWFGGKKMKAPIGFDKVVEILNKFNAPTDILTKYLELVEDLDIRLSLSKKISNHKVTVETLVKLKDRAGVEDFAHKHGGTIEADYARRMLKDELGMVGLLELSFSNARIDKRNQNSGVVLP